MACPDQNPHCVTGRIGAQVPGSVIDIATSASAPSTT